MEEFRAKFGGGEGMAELLATQTAAKSTSLKWYVDPYSKTPLWVQYIYLWFKRAVFRRPLE